jgi:hypothetical protein
MRIPFGNPAAKKPAALKVQRAKNGGSYRIRIEALAPTSSIVDENTFRHSSCKKARSTKSATG